MFVQGYHGLLSQSMTTERMYGKVLTVCSVFYCEQNVHAFAAHVAASYFQYALGIEQSDVQFLCKGTFPHACSAPANVLKACKLWIILMVDCTALFN